MSSDLIYFLGLLLLGAALLLSVYRLVRGPTACDRILTLDLLGGLGLGVLVMTSIRYHQPVFLDVAVVLALVGFIGTVAFARLVNPDGDPSDR